MIMSEFFNGEADQPLREAIHEETVRLTGADGLDDLYASVAILIRDIRDYRKQPDSYSFRSTIIDPKRRRIEVNGEKNRTGEEKATIQVSDRRIRDLFTSTTGGEYPWEHHINTPTGNFVQSLSTEAATSAISSLLEIDESLLYRLDEENRATQIARHVLGLPGAKAKEHRDKSTHRILDFQVDPYVLMSRKAELNYGRRNPDTTYSHLGLTALISLEEGTRGLVEKLHFYTENNATIKGRGLTVVKLALEGDANEYTKKELEPYVKFSAKEKGEDHITTLLEAIKSLRRGIFSDAA